MPPGRSGRRWRRLTQEVYARRAHCCRCHQPIDYTRPYRDPTTGRVDLESKSVDHYPHPLSTHPQLAEEPTNLAAAHLRCNLDAGASNSEVGLGTPSREW